MTTIAAQPELGRERRRAPVPLLFLNVFVIAVCGLVYELLAGTLASYLLGDSVSQFSFVIGIYLSAMGVGAWLSRFLTTELSRRFLEVELCVALVGGLSAPALFFAFAHEHLFRAVLYGIVFAIGALVGLELPLLMRILERDLDFKELVSRVLAFDYIGALVASLLFPLVLVPSLGLVRTSFAMGILNAGIALWGTSLLGAQFTRGHAGLRARAVVLIALFVVGMVKADALSRTAEERLFAGEIVYAETTPYQRIVVTSARQGFQLFLNGNLQLSSSDEYRYHEALVHPAMAATQVRKRVLVLGGGDGLALRELFRYPEVEHVTLVDLDPAMTSLSRRVPALAALNQHSFDDARLEVVHADAFVWLQEPHEPYDVVLIDFPDPNNFALGKLYTRHFYRLVERVLTPAGALAIQATSPLYARESFWCVVATVEAAGFATAPYHATVPSFGEWGYVLARKEAFTPPSKAPLPGLKFLDDVTLAHAFAFPADMSRVDAGINRLDNQLLVHTYDTEWRRWAMAP